jgi:hypothetical protein
MREFVKGFVAFTLGFFLMFAIMRTVVILVQ